MVRFLPQFLQCRLGRHEPDRKHVTWDGGHFVGSCSSCGMAVRREKHGVWRRDWLMDSGQVTSPDEKML